ncbi:MAG: hypothetical protein IT423_15855 [Pirellulaceae bacterium]|nr:hypothetical protein [Pirellulaceae bacterium]
MHKPQHSSKHLPSTPSTPVPSAPLVVRQEAAHELSHDEAAILDTFAKYLMPPEQMLCLTNTDSPSVRQALDRLVQRGWMTAQSFKGGYSLTVDGFNAMSQRRSKRTAGNK